MWAAIVAFVMGIIGLITGRKQAAGVAQGKAEQSNEQLKHTLKEKEDARKGRERTEESIKSLPPDDVVDKLR